MTPMPGLSCNHTSLPAVIDALTNGAPADVKFLLNTLRDLEWEWTLHWYLTLWGGPSVTINGWSYGSMFVAQWTAAREGDDLKLTTCIFKPVAGTKFSTLTLAELLDAVETT